MMNVESKKSLIQNITLQQEDTEIQMLHPNKEQLTRRHALVPEPVSTHYSLLRFNFSLHI